MRPKSVKIAHFFITITAILITHLSTVVAWREKKFKHFVFYKYFSLVLGLLKSRISEKTIEPLLRKTDFTFSSKTPTKRKLRFWASIAILSFSVNIGAYIIYLGTFSGLSDLELGLEGSKCPLNDVLCLFFCRRWVTN